MIPAILASLMPALGKVIDNVMPDKAEEAKAELAKLTLSGSQDIQRLETELSAIVMEAQSQDPFTSRARPSFLYVVYIYVLAAIPMGGLFAYSPETAANVTLGVQNWLAAIPGEMWSLFGVGYLGYTGARTWEKRKIIDARSR